MLWEAGDRVCGKRLKALIPILIGAMERHGHLNLNAEIKAKLLQVSAATIDRALGDARSRVNGQRRRRTGVGAAIRRSIPVRTFSDWRNPPSEFFEVDMVEHCGGAMTDGDFVHRLVLTDIATGWTKCIAMPVRNQSLVVEAMAIAATDYLPFAMLGVDTDNDSAFINQTVFDYCRATGLADALAGVQEERLGMGRAEERRHRSPTGGLWQAWRPRGRTARCARRTQSNRRPSGGGQLGRTLSRTPGRSSRAH